MRYINLHLHYITKSLIGRLGAKSLDNYEEMKRFLLGEFKLTAMEYKTRFDTASKHSDETHALFASRLHNELRYYLSRLAVALIISRSSVTCLLAIS